MADNAGATSPALSPSGNLISVCLCVEARPETAAFFASLSPVLLASSQYTHILLGLPATIKPESTVSSASVNVTLTDEDRKRVQRQLELEYGVRVHPVFLPNEVDATAESAIHDQEDWTRYAEQVILPICQGNQSKLASEQCIEKAQADHQRLNEIFADTIMNVYKPGDIVIIHGYQLLLLPSILRQKLPYMNVGFALHVTFPAVEHFPSLQMQQQILGGVLGADLLIFQTPACTEHFQDLCNKALSIKTDADLIEFNGARVALLSKTAIDKDDQSWTDKYIEGLLAHLKTNNRPRNTPALDLTEFQTQYIVSRRRLVLLDYDGTLTKIVAHAELAIPTERTIQALRTLTSNPRNTVWIISGRDQEFLSHHFGSITALGLSAEHGCFVRAPNSTKWENLAESLDMTWKPMVDHLFTECSKEAEGAWVERKKVGITWHYRGVKDQERVMEMAKLCQKNIHENVVRKYDVEVMAGKANLEVRPRFINKGETVKRIVKAYGEGEDEVPDFVFCAGDDFTDEDMFQKLRGMHGVFTVKVGPSSLPTLAKWHVEEPEDIVAAIELLNR